MEATEANTPKMRICIVNEFFYPDDAGGTGTVLSELANTLRSDYPAVEIDVVTSTNFYRDKDRKHPKYGEWDGIRIFRLAAPHPGGLPAIPRLMVNAWFGLKALAKLLRRPRYDLLLIGTAPPTVALAADLYKRLKRVPYLYIVYDLEPDRAVSMGIVSARCPLVPLLRRAQRRWLHAAAKVIVLGRCMSEHIGRTYELPPHQIEAIAIGSDAEAIRPASKDTRFRAAHGLHGFVVCYSGNFGRYHNFDTILDAAKDLHSRQAKVTFVLVGGGAQKAHIARRIADEQIANVQMHPFVAQEDYPDLLASADVSLVTLEPGMEGLCVPSKFYSILASGRPTIALVSPKSEVARVIDESGCGIHMAQGDAAGLSSVLLTLSQDQEAADAMGRRARTILETRYSTRRVAALYYRAMQVACSSGRQAETVYAIPIDAPQNEPAGVLEVGIG